MHIILDTSLEITNTFTVSDLQRIHDVYDKLAMLEGLSTSTELQAISSNLDMLNAFPIGTVSQVNSNTALYQSVLSNLGVLNDVLSNDAKYDSVIGLTDEINSILGLGNTLTTIANSINGGVFKGDTGATGSKGDTGLTGATGAKGDSGTLAIGTVTSLPSTSSASVVNVGTSSAAVLNISIPRGELGLTGLTGKDGKTPTFIKTSDTSYNLSLGSKTFHFVDDYEVTGFGIGTDVKIFNSVNAYAKGIITGISSAYVDVTITDVKGTGIFNSWYISILGAIGNVPNHEINNGQIRFELSDGSFGEWINTTTGNTIGNTTGNTLNNTQGNTTGNTLNNTVGNTVGNTIGNTVGNTLNNTAGNTVGNTVGNKGWSPILATEVYGSKLVLKVIDWQGGEYTKPAVNVYITPTGYSYNITDASDFKGAKGDTGLTGNTGATGATGGVNSVNTRQGDIVLTKSDIGLNNVDNTSDANKPISTSTQTALNAKQATLVSGTNIKTVNGNNLLGSGNLSLVGLPVGGTTAQTLFKNSATDGDAGWTTLTKSNVGLSLVDNTSDVNKPISTATQAVLNAKQATLVSGTNIKTVNNVSLLGSGDVVLSGLPSGGTVGQILSKSASGAVWQTLDKTTIGLSDVDNTSDTSKPVSTATQTALNLKANSASPTFTGTVSGITKAMVGLSSVDNTSDVNKPISTSVATALNAKQATLVSGTNIKTVNGNVLLGSGNITLVGLPIGGTASQTLFKNSATDGDASWGTLSKTVVGLDMVDNTADTSKPISTATQTALNAKQATLVSGTNIKTINGNSLLGSGEVSYNTGLVSTCTCALPYKNVNNQDNPSFHAMAQSTPNTLGGSVDGSGYWVCPQTGAYDLYIEGRPDIENRGGIYGVFQYELWNHSTGSMIAAGDKNWPINGGIGLWCKVITLGAVISQGHQIKFGYQMYMNTAAGGWISAHTAKIVFALRR